MKKVYSATEARKQFFKILELAGKPGMSITITLAGKTPLVLMSQEELEGWKETLEIMTDTELMKRIREGEEDIRAGRTITLEEMEQKLHARKRKRR
jgi:prevent-host-death family protein